MVASIDNEVNGLFDELFWLAARRFGSNLQMLGLDLRCKHLAPVMWEGGWNGLVKLRPDRKGAVLVGFGTDRCRGCGVCEWHYVNYPTLLRSP